jgi:hypothetical protein
MSVFLLSKENQGIVVFHVWKSLKYKMRLIVSLSFIVLGFLMQFFAVGSVMEGELIFLGFLTLFFGNLLLLVKGYNNKITLNSYSSDREWVKADEERLAEIVKINVQSKKWDINSLDITNPSGGVVFVFVLIAIIVYSVKMPTPVVGIIIALNGLALFLPHWVTGVRSITTTPKLVSKIRLYQKLMNSFRSELSENDIDFLLYVKGKEEKLPLDVKMKIAFKNQPEDFLGMYAQIALNDVNGSQYPYFYVVLVAKKTGLLKNYKDKVLIPKGVIREYKEEGTSEILVIRQYTTSSSGYHTKQDTIVSIFESGLKNCRALFA